MKRLRLPGSLQTPSWKWNLMIMAVFASAAIVYVSWQLKQNRAGFYQHALEHARLIGEIMARNAEQAASAQQLYTDVIAAFLSSSADFIIYLDGIEPFAPSELEAFAWENGLVLIGIERRDGSFSRYPDQWPADVNSLQSAGLHHLAQQHLYVLRRTYPEMTLTLAIPATRLEKLQEQLSQAHLLDLLAGLPGIAYIHTSALSDESVALEANVQMRDATPFPIAEARLPLEGDKHLIVGLEAKLYHQRRQALFMELGGLGVLLCFTGVILAWVLYQQQRLMVRHTRGLERRLAQQHEEAALGRAADSISHEIRNPLNAISMGLQRIEFEAHLEQEHANLVHAMQQAVKRSTTIVTQLQRFARPLKPQYASTNLNTLLHRSMDLYRPMAHEGNIELMDFSEEEECVIQADAALLEHALENLIKNSIEAQPHGGRVEVRLQQQPQGEVVISVGNQIDEATAIDMDAILEPYVSSKARGTGLGLPMVQKIVRAHGGEVRITRPHNTWLEVGMILPRARPE
jgi:signal transduction histidine kinase